MQADAVEATMLDVQARQPTPRPPRSVRWAGGGGTVSGQASGKFQRMLAAGDMYERARAEYARLLEIGGVSTVRLSAAAEDEAESMFSYFDAFTEAVREAASPDPRPDREEGR